MTQIVGLSIVLVLFSFQLETIFRKFNKLQMAREIREIRQINQKEKNK
jgi:hypothetical protein